MQGSDVLDGEIMIEETHYTEIVLIEQPVEGQAYDEDTEMIVLYFDNGLRVFIG